MSLGTSTAYRFRVIQVRLVVHLRKYYQEETPSSRMPDADGAFLALTVRRIGQDLGKWIPKDCCGRLEGDTMLPEVARRLGWISREPEVAHPGASVSSQRSSSQAMGSGRVCVMDMGEER